MSVLPAAPGTYLLLLESAVSVTLKIGRGGELELRPGWYAYVGSAFGPGGLAARVGRHLRGGGDRPRWHIDYLRRRTRPREVWHAPGPERLEHLWAARLHHAPDLASPLAGFGAGDCACPTHLFRLTALPGAALLERLGTGGVARFSLRSGETS